MDEKNNKNKAFSDTAIKKNEAAALPPEQKEDESLGGFFREIFKFTIIAIIIVAPIRFFIAQPFIVSGASMDPTFGNGQYLIIDEITYRLNPPERGDVIVFKYPEDPSKYFIKRIIGLPGETVDIKNEVVTITSPENPSGFTLSEPYIEYQSTGIKTMTLSEDEYFVMGDNRSNSLDSRVWGPVPKKNIVGRALVRMFPLTKIGMFPGKETQ